LRRLTEQLLDLSQLDARRVAVRPEPLDVQETLAEIVRETLPADLAVELRVEPSLNARLDPMVLDRIVSNLLLNAARYGAAPIVLSAERANHRVRIAVEDNGPGVPEELQPRLFERFARGSGAVGPGLGLTIARAYARVHGGELVLVPTTGSRFELTVPRSQS